MDKKIDIIRLQVLLQSRENLPLRHAALLATTIAYDLDERLLPAVNAWMDEKLETSFGVEDCTLQDIIDDTGAGLMEALLMLNLQLQHPERIDEPVWVLRGEEYVGADE